MEMVHFRIFHNHSSLVPIDWVKPNTYDFLAFNLFFVFVFQVDLRHNDELNGTNIVEIGVDLSEFYPSVEWDILEVPAVR